MFKEEYILDLISGHLTEKGYASIVGTIATMARRYHWPKDIIVSNNTRPDWTDDDIKELSQQFFEWVLEKEKVKYVEKIPYEYIGYYFTQILVSFIANRVKEEQQKVGISYQKCKKLVGEICEEDYSVETHLNKTYVISTMESTNKWVDDLEDSIKYLAHYPITESTKHYKSIVKLVIEDILQSAGGYVLLDKLAEAVYKLLDQSSFSSPADESFVQVDATTEKCYEKEICSILDGVSKLEAQIFLEYIFQDQGQVSLSKLELKYNIPKSTIHKKTDDFKRKIFSAYIPENEKDGISFLKKLAEALDEKAK